MSNRPKRLPAIFIDRDGVVNHNRSDYVKSCEEFDFLPGSMDALCLLGRLGWPIVIVSNQSAIGRGLVAAETVTRITTYLVEQVRRAGGHIDGVYVCPHHPDEGCDCRKPRPGLLQQASRELGVDLQCSYLIGDAESDILAALAVSAQPILVLSGRGCEQRQRLAGFEGMFQVFDDLREAASWIVSKES